MGGGDGGRGVTNGSSMMGGVCIHTCPWVGEVA